MAEMDLRVIERHHEASIASLILSLRCGLCHPNAPLPLLRGLAREKSAIERQGAI